MFSFFKLTGRSNPLGGLLVPMLLKPYVFMPAFLMNERGFA